MSTGITPPTPNRISTVPISNAPANPGTPQPRRWTRDEYYRLGESGVFEGDRVELIGGEIVEMSPQHADHYTCILLLTRRLANAFGEGYCVRPQGPLEASDESEPESDVAVVRGREQDYLHQHPQDAVLVVEFSASSLVFDRERKSHLYASMMVPEYWIVNLPERVVEIHTNPVGDRAAPFGHRYADIRRVSEDANVAPLETPGSSISVSDILPPPAPQTLN